GDETMLCHDPRRSFMIRRREAGATPAASTSYVRVTRRLCCPQAGCWWRPDCTGVIPRTARNFMIRRVGHGRRPAAWARHARNKRRLCCPQGKCWWREDAIVVTARNAMIPRREAGAPPAVSAPHAIITRRRCCPQARCWWRGGTVGLVDWAARRSLIRRRDQDGPRPAWCTGAARERRRADQHERRGTGWRRGAW